MISDDRKSALDYLAWRLAAAWKIKGVIGAVSSDDVPRDRPEAYYTQDRVAEILGLPVVGWKIGATTAVMRERDGHEDIIPGRLFEPTTHFGNHVTLDLGDCPNPRVETEFGFRLNADMPLREGPWTAEEVTPLITVHPALEVIGTRFEMPEGTPGELSRMGVSDNGVCIAGVFGEPATDAASFDFAGHTVAFTVDDSAPSADLLGEARCDGREAVANLANLLAKRGVSLQAGAMLLTGTVTVPLAVKKGSHLVADFGSLGRMEMDFT